MESASDQAEEEQRDLWPEGVEALSKDAISSLADGPRDKNTIVALYAPWCQFSQVCKNLLRGTKHAVRLNVLRRFLDTCSIKLLKKID